MERKNHGSRMDAPQFGRHDALPAAMGALWVRLSLVIPFCMLFAHKGYIAQYRFFRRRMGHSVLRSFWLTYQNHCRFAEIILDRFYVYAGGNLHFDRSEEHTSELQSRQYLVCRLLLEKKKKRMLLYED